MINEHASEILNQVKEQIRSNPESFDMREWDCGTTACIAGWICRNAESWLHSSREAAKIVNLPEDEVYALFFEYRWPLKLYREYVEAKRANCSIWKASVACRAIDAFIEDPSSFQHPK